MERPAAKQRAAAVTGRGSNGRILLGNCGLRRGGKPEQYRREGV